MLYKEITACRSCGSTKLESVLNLGNLCISDWIKPGQQEDRAPLELLVCEDCSLVQLRHTVDRDRLYRSYYYRSGVNESMVAALKDVVEDACSRVELVKGDAVLDIGANDGTLLKMFPKKVLRQGFEPSNIGSDIFSDCTSDIVILPGFFPDDDLMDENYANAKFKIITSIAMFYDVDNPNVFVNAIKARLHPDGVWIVQFQDLHSMLACNGVDNICHEHLTYWGSYAFYQLCARHGLRVVAASHNNTNGGSVRYVVKHGRWLPPRPQPIHATQFGFQLQNFAREAELLKERTLDLLWRLEMQSAEVVGVAASTKANTLLQYYDVFPTLLPAIADRNPDKVGLQTVGTHIPIISEDEMRALKPDYLMALAWHFMEPFRQRYADLEAAGTKWIKPLPKLEMFGGGICQTIPDGLCARA